LRRDSEVIHAVGEEVSTSGDGGVSPLGAQELDKVLEILFAHSGSKEVGLDGLCSPRYDKVRGTT
jgi:hypothetical protein